MDLFQAMKSFVTTVNVGSMSSAASELKLTPAMIGQHIASLEARLGTRLLNRTTRRQSLTDFGKTYFEQCRDILERVALVDLEAEAHSSEAQGLLRVTAPVTFGVSLLVPTLRKFRQSSPLVKIELILTDQNLDIVENGIDVAFRVGLIPDSRIIQRTLMPYKMVVCASAEYVTQRGMPHEPTELVEHELIGFTKTTDTLLTFFNHDRLVEVKPLSMISMNSGYALLSAAKSGLGIIIQPEMLLKNDLESGALVRILPDWHLGERQLSMIYYRHKNMTPKVRNFLDFSIKEFHA
ncbi:LysR family transcriptional regulator [Sessilibacter sp. MAH1]